MIAKKRNAEVHGSGVPNLMNYLNGANQRAFTFNYNQVNRSGQCKRCKSDYMKFSIDGFCQSCLQKVEFIIRERPHILQQVGQQNFQGAQGV